MSEFVRAGALGGYRPVAGGQSDPECTHVILTKNEYDQILLEKARAEQLARTIKVEADRAINDAQRSASYKAQQAAEEARKAVEHMEAALGAERAESAHQRALNANLLRIAKERANADRKLKPKKEHTGYGVVFSGEKEHRYKDGNRRWKKKLLWETVIQSPYTVDLSEPLARKQITDELIRNDEAGSCMIYKIGIGGFYPGSYAAMSDDREWCAEPERFNIMLQPQFRANFRSGYWEVVFLHTKPLGVVPKDMRVS